MGRKGSNSPGQGSGKSSAGRGGNGSGTRLVYSTEHGSAIHGGASGHGGSGPSRPKKGKKGRRGASAVPQAPADGTVRVWRQTAGRKGKGVTVITGLDLDPSALAVLAAELKKKCGSGGTVKGRVLEIQGDHREALVAELRGRGWRVIKAGG